MRTARRAELEEDTGQDSFLDVLTNMVGIIILLVVVMGLRASRAASTALVAQDPTLAATAEQIDVQKNLRDAANRVQRAENDLQRLVKQALDVRRETLLREQEREYLSTYVAAFNEELNQRRDILSVEQQRDFDLRRQLTEAETSLDELAREQVALLSQPTEAELLENRPTPIVHTHTGKELYLQLSEGHVAVIPLADLIAEFKEDASQNVWRLKDENSFSGTVGPIGGFRLRYLVGRRVVRLESVAGTFQQTAGAQLIKCELLPVITPLGDPVDLATMPNSELFQQLKRFRPDATVVAIGVYPDSIRELHQLKRALQDAGYDIAEKLMTEGEPIGFSPHGQALYAQ